MKKILFLTLISVFFITSCTVSNNVSLGYVRNSNITPNSNILIVPFNVGNQELQTYLTQDFVYYMIKKNRFNVSVSNAEVKEDLKDIESLNSKYDYVVFTKVLRYDIKDFRPIFSIDMTIYNTFDGSIAWKLHYPFYWNDPETEKFISESFGKDYDFNKFYNSKDSIRNFADIVLEAISYTIAKMK